MARIGDNGSGRNSSLSMNFRAVARLTRRPRTGQWILKAGGSGASATAKLAWSFAAARYLIPDGLLIRSGFGVCVVSSRLAIPKRSRAIAEGTGLADRWSKFTLARYEPGNHLFDLPGDWRRRSAGPHRSKDVPSCYSQRLSRWSQLLPAPD